MERNIAWLTDKHEFMTGMFGFVETIVEGARITDYYTADELMRAANKIPYDLIILNTAIPVGLSPSQGLEEVIRGIGCGELQRANASFALVQYMIKQIKESKSNKATPIVILGDIIDEYLAVDPIEASKEAGAVAYFSWFDEDGRSFAESVKKLLETKSLR